MFDRVQQQGGRVLIVGDGDLSFARAFIASLPRLRGANATSRQIVATTFDPLDTLLTKYPQVENTVDEIRANPEALVGHAVDATNLLETLPASVAQEQFFDFVIWNFPHAGGKNFIAKNRALMCGFFQSARQVLRPHLQKNIPQILVSLVCAQGGTDFEILHVPEAERKSSRKPLKRNYADHWQIVESGALSGFCLSHIGFFRPPANYHPRGYRDELKTAKKGFRTEYSVTHGFSLLPFPEENALEQIRGCRQEIMRTLVVWWEGLCRAKDPSMAVSHQEEISFSPLPHSCPRECPHSHTRVTVSCTQKQVEEIVVQMCRPVSSVWTEVADERHHLHIEHALESPEHTPGSRVAFLVGVFNPHTNEFTTSAEFLLMSLLKIEDVRWFSSRRRDVLEQIKRLLDQHVHSHAEEGKGKMSSFSPPSLFSPKFQRDISFFVPPGKSELTHRELGPVLQAWAPTATTLYSWELLERYQRSETEISECYRLVLQQIDGALHPSQVETLQDELLLHLEQSLGIVRRGKPRGSH